ncbi:hypothetical protein [Prevotella sp. oral taxon 820]|nr:hypothetical protein [Prevotella sp. oral taxon 820]
MLFGLLALSNDPKTSLNSYRYETLIKFNKRYQLKKLLRKRKQSAVPITN